MIGKDFKARCSNLHPLMAGGTNGGLTSSEKKMLNDLIDKKKRVDNKETKERWTSNNTSDLRALEAAKDRPVSLGRGAITICETFFREWYFNRKKTSPSTDTTTKGTLQETEGIEVVKRVLGRNFMEKYEGRRLSNNYIIGMPDVIEPDAIFEFKSPKDCWTHPLFDLTCPKKEYLDQVQGYMEIYGKNKAYIVYVLVDMPEHIIDKHIYYSTKDIQELTQELYEKISDRVRADLTYSNLPDEKRVKIFEVKKDTEFIPLVNKKVELMREYIDELYRIHVTEAKILEQVEIYTTL